LATFDELPHQLTGLVKVDLNPLCLSHANYSESDINREDDEGIVGCSRAESGILIYEFLE
jgi:hypothetical protein